MMRSVCFIGNYAHFSGALEVFRNVASYLKSHGWRTAYVFHAQREGDLIPDLSMFDEVIPCIQGSDPNYPEQLAEVANRFSVLHTSLIPQDWRYSFKKNVTRPMVETYHSPDGWKMCWQQFKWRIKGGHERPADVTIAVSHGLGKEIRGDLNTDVRVIPNGVHIPEVVADGDYVTYCGRISTEKGLDDWLKVATKVRERVPKAKFQWVGELSPHYDPVQFRWLQAGCPWLEFAGFHRDVSPFYLRSKCLLLTSPSEGLPMSILEAQAHGVPSFAYPVGDIPETGACLVSGVDHAAGQIERLFHDGWSNEQAVSLREQMRQHFSADSMGRSHLEIYEALCAT